MLRWQQRPSVATSRKHGGDAAAAAGAAAAERGVAAVVLTPRDLQGTEPADQRQLARATVLLLPPLEGAGQAEWVVSWWAQALTPMSMHHRQEQTLHAAALRRSHHRLQQATQRNNPAKAEAAPAGAVGLGAGSRGGALHGSQWTLVAQPRDREPLR